jgi:hypothetical protein
MGTMHTHLRLRDSPLAAAISVRGVAATGAHVSASAHSASVRTAKTSGGTVLSAVLGTPSMP